MARYGPRPSARRRAGGRSRVGGAAVPSNFLVAAIGTTTRDRRGPVSATIPPPVIAIASPATAGGEGYPDSRIRAGAASRRIRPRSRPPAPAAVHAPGPIIVAAKPPPSDSRYRSVTPRGGDGGMIFVIAQ